MMMMTNRKIRSSSSSQPDECRFSTSIRPPTRRCAGDARDDHYHPPRIIAPMMPSSSLSSKSRLRGYLVVMLCTLALIIIYILLYMTRLPLLFPDRNPFWTFSTSTTTTSWLPDVLLLQTSSYGSLLNSSWSSSSSSISTSAAQLPPKLVVQTPSSTPAEEAPSATSNKMTSLVDHHKPPNRLTQLVDLYLQYHPTTPTSPGSFPHTYHNQTWEALSEMFLSTETRADDLGTMAPVIPDPVWEVMQQHADACHGKERLLTILWQAQHACFKGEYSDRGRIFCDWHQFCAQLPSEAQITALYGSWPVVWGLERCATYRERLLPTATGTGNGDSSSSSSSPSPPRVRLAGLYNTGTNALALNFLYNLQDGTTLAREQHVLDEAFTLYNVPWGKHMPASFRFNHTFPPHHADSSHRSAVLPVILVRDPWRWMFSMCKAPYDATWTRIPGRCPSLVRTSSEMNFHVGRKPLATYPVTVTPAQGYQQHTMVYDSLADWWNEWYRQYWDMDEPRLLIRYEDTLYHGEAVMQLIHGCVGLIPPNSTGFQPFVHDSKSRPLLGTGLARLFIKNGLPTTRLNHYAPADLAYAANVLDGNLLQQLGYAPVSPPPT